MAMAAVLSVSTDDGHRHQVSSPVAEPLPPAAIVIHHAAVPRRLVPLPASRKTTAPVGVPVRKTVRYDFAGGLTADIWDPDRILRLHAVGAKGGVLEARERGEGIAVGYPPPCLGPPEMCPRVLLESDSAAWLNPDQRDVRWGARVLLGPDQTTDGENVVQKGFSTAGTQFKLQVDHYGGLPSCVVAGLVFGINRIYVAQWNRTVADGLWHTLDCVRVSTGLALYVDGELRKSVTVPAPLSIVNPDPLRLGGKGLGPWNDQFHGVLDDVYVTIG